MLNREPNLDDLKNLLDVYLSDCEHGPNYPGNWSAIEPANYLRRRRGMSEIDRYPGDLEHPWSIETPDGEKPLDLWEADDLAIDTIYKICWDTLTFEEAEEVLSLAGVPYWELWDDFLAEEIADSTLLAQKVNTYYQHRRSAFGLYMHGVILQLMRTADGEFFLHDPKTDDVTPLTAEQTADWLEENFDDLFLFF